MSKRIFIPDDLIQGVRRVRQNSYKSPTWRSTRRFDEPPIVNKCGSHGFSGGFAMALEARVIGNMTAGSRALKVQGLGFRVEGFG